MKQSQKEREALNSRLTSRMQPDSQKGSVPQDKFKRTGEAKAGAGGAMMGQ